jgi:fatty acid amide hydrolase
VSANFTGVYSFRPTQQRCTDNGIHAPTLSGLIGQTQFSYCVCPVSKTVEGLALTMRSLWSLQYKKSPNFKIQDANLLNLPFNEDLYMSTNSLNIAWFDSHSYFETSASVKEAMKKSVELLRSLGHRLIQIPQEDLPDLESAMTLYMSIMNTTTMPARNSFLKSESPIQNSDWNHKFYNMSSLKRKLHTLFSFKQKRFNHIMHNSGPKSTYEHGNMFKLRTSILKQFMTFVKQKKIDAVICPAFPIPAPKTADTEKLFIGNAYSIFMGVIGLPTAVVPIDSVRNLVGEGVENNEKEMYESEHSDEITCIAKRNLEGCENLSVGVQISCLPFKDELALNIAKQIQTLNSLQ